MSSKTKNKEFKQKEIDYINRIHSTSSIAAFDWFKSIMFAIAIIAVFLSFVLRPVNVDGDSMNSTLLNNDKVIVSNLMYKPTNGDIVVVAHGGNLQKTIIKRVIATEGQSLKIDYDRGEVYVDGVLIEEKYIKGITSKPLSPLDVPAIIPKGKVFVMGDNRENSLDSRSKEVGLIPSNDILGKAEAIVYSFNRISFL